MKQFSDDPNLLGLGLSRHWEGAIIGGLAVLLVGLLCSMSAWLPFMLFAISSIPAALIGSLIVSKNTKQRTFGIALLLAFIALSVYFVFNLLAAISN